MTFTLEELKDTIETFAPTQVDFYVENCIVALEKSNHKSGLEMETGGDKPGKVVVQWSKKVNSAGYKEEKKFTEHGATAIAFFMTFKYSEYTVVEEATIGTGFDYWLGYKSDDERYDPRNFMQARLEVSGIFKETTDNNINKRIRTKKTQTDISDNTKLPAYVAIMEFSTPKAYFGKK